MRDGSTRRSDSVARAQLGAGKSAPARAPRNVTPRTSKERRQVRRLVWLPLRRTCDLRRVRARYGEEDICAERDDPTEHHPEGKARGTSARHKGDAATERSDHADKRRRGSGLVSSRRLLERLGQYEKGQEQDRDTDDAVRGE